MLNRPGRIAAQGLLLFLLLLRWLDPAPIEALRLQQFDLSQRLAPRVYIPQPVVVVAIDEASLRQFGQWPWPRSLIARLVSGIAKGGPASIGLDILFTEPDRLSPPRLAETLTDLQPELRAALAAQPSSDHLLADVLRPSRVVLGLGGVDLPTATTAPMTLTPVREAAGDPRPFLPFLPGLAAPIPELAAAAAGRGILTVDPDRDGVVRTVPLGAVAGGRLLPAWTLELVRVATGVRTLTIDVSTGGIDGWRIGDLSAPTEHDGSRRISYRASRSTQFISAATVLDGTAALERFKGAIVLAGVTALGLVDVKPTPLGPMQGIEIQAQLIENLLSGEALWRPAASDRWELVATALLGLLIILFLPYQRPARAGALLLCLLLLLVGGAQAAHAGYGLLVDVTWPILAMVLCATAMLAATVAAAERTRLRLELTLADERTVAARLESEIAAARSIQMGILPRRFPAFPERKDFDLYALIEPARTVGGDLYDFLLIDDDHLFFMIGDVSGKGIPAALFMAVSKALFKSRAVHNSDAGERPSIARIMTEANREIAREDPEMLFVTVLAGILHLRTGKLEYACAGHDAPILLSAGQPARTLEPVGGPPLCALDDFEYPLELAQLAPGDALVLFTDGVTEALNPAHELYSLARVTRVFNEAGPTETAQALVERLHGDVKQFAQGAEQSDDITIFTLRWWGPRA